MEARAILKYARISPRKVKIVMDLIRNQDADKAMAILKFTPKSACEYLEKPKRLLWDSRPFDELPTPFLCAITNKFFRVCYSVIFSMLIFVNS